MGWLNKKIISTVKKLHTIDKIYIICHKEKEQERYARWLSWTDKRTDVEFFSYKWADELCPAEISSWYVRNPEVEARESQYRTFPLNNAEISCSINWIKLLEHAYHSGHERVLIFESDAYFDEYFEDDLNRAIKLINLVPKNQIDIVSIGAGGGQRYSVGDGCYVPGLFKVNSVRALEAVIFTRSGIQKTLAHIYKTRLTMVFDIELKYAVESGIINMFWLEPSIVRQLSVDGLVDSYLNQGQFRLLNYGPYQLRQ